MKKLAILNVCLAASVGQPAWAGTMGAVSDAFAINPGVIVGIDGGVNYTDVTNLTLVPGILNVVLPLASSSISSVSGPTSISNYTGALGGFIGYKFPLTSHFAFEPMVGYHYLWKPSFDGVLSVNNDSGSHQNLGIHSQHNLNIVDLTVQGNYRLDNGWNFFVQPGVAVVIDKVSLSVAQSFVNTTGVVTSASADTGTGTNVALRPEIGVGLGKMLTEHVNLFARYTFIDGNDIEVLLPIVTPNINTFSIGLSWEA